jgi:predicted transcriptional regulator
MDYCGYSKEHIASFLGVSTQTVSAYLREPLSDSDFYNALINQINTLVKLTKINRKYAFDTTQKLLNYDEKKIEYFSEYMTLHSRFGRADPEELINESFKFLNKLDNDEFKKKKVWLTALLNYLVGFGYVYLKNWTRLGIYWGVAILCILWNVLLPKLSTNLFIPLAIASIVDGIILTIKYNKEVDANITDLMYKGIKHAKGKINTEQKSSFKDGHYSMVCPLCDKHINIKLTEMPHRSQEKKLECPECETPFNISLEDKYYVCTGCKKILESLDKKDKHTNTCEKYQERTFKCDYCDKSFTLDDKEIRKLKADSNLTVECPSCQKKNHIMVKTA